MKIIRGLTPVNGRILDKDYKKILDETVLSCIDLVVIRYSPKAEVLMVHRTEPPAQDKLWFPGGRRIKNIAAEDMIHEILRREVGLHKVDIIRQIGSFDFSSRKGIFNDLSNGFHAQCACYLATPQEHNPLIVIDHTSKDYAWRSYDDIVNTPGGVHPYIAEVLNAARVFVEPIRNIDHSLEE